jgi:phage/plasmid-associated DNA primase
VDIDHEDLDADHDLIDWNNGTLDLGTGELRPHQPEDYCTLIAEVAFIPSSDS